MADDPLANAMPQDEFEQFAQAIEHTETGGTDNPARAVSPKGARGVMQIMPATARQYGVNPNDLWNPEVNRKLGRRILSENLTRYGGDKRKAAWAYNAGPGAVDEGRMPHETRGYIDKVLGWLGPSEASAAEDPLSNATPYSAPAGGGTKDDPLANAVPASKPDSLPPEAGSVFSREPTTGEQLKSDVKTGAELATGVGVPLAAGALLGPEASAPARIGMQALAGAATPFAEAGVAKLMGDKPQMPGWQDALKSAAFNAGLTSVGEGIGALASRASAVRPEMKAFPGPQSPKTIKQAMRNRDFLKGMGLDDTQIDDVLKSPDTQARLAEQVVAGQRYKGAFQSVLDSTRGTFAGQYNAILGNVPGTVDAVPIGQMMENLAQGSGQHELSPTLRAFLQRKGLELTRAGEATGPSVGGTPWKHLPESLKQKLHDQGVGQGISTPSQDLSVEDLHSLRTELRENVPASATNLDKQVAAQINKSITDQMTARMTKPQAAALEATDAEYGRFMDVLQKLDPRDQRYGEQVANALFDPMVKNPGDALKFVDLAQHAEQSRPGQVMPQLREAFANKILSEARTPGGPMEELRALRKVQETWGTDKNARAVISGIFGKDSPLVDPVTFTKVLGTADNPRAVVDAVGKPSVMHSVLSSPYMQAYAMSGLLMAASGIKGGGLWGELTGDKGPEAQVTALASLLVGPLVFGKVLGSGNAALQRSMVGFMTNPNARTITRYMGALSGATAGGLISLPTQSEQSAPPNP